LTPFLINGRFLTSRVTGVQRYCIELINELDRQMSDKGHPGHARRIPILVPNSYKGQDPWTHFPIKRAGMLNANLWEQICLPFGARNAMLFSPANIGAFLHFNQVVTIHDASVFAVPEAYNFRFRLKYKVSHWRMAHSARAIITDSEFSKSELVRWCGVRREKIRAIHLGHEHFLRIRPIPEVLTKLDLSPGSYFLSVGSRSPHKNLASLLEGYVQLPFPKPKLVLVGGEFGKVFAAGQQAELPEGALQTGYVQDGELRYLYENAAALVFPSLYEGFGFPILEAFALNCPVICSNATSLPEVAGEAALFFDPANPAEIAVRLREVMADDGLRRQLAEKGRQRLSLFTWEECARQTWRVLWEAAEST